MVLEGMPCFPEDIQGITRQVLEHCFMHVQDERSLSVSQVLLFSRNAVSRFSADSCMSTNSTQIKGISKGSLFCAGTWSICNAGDGILRTS